MTYVAPTMVPGAMARETVGQLAELYLGNILYAIERAALALEEQGKRDDAAFYRGIARKLADAHGQSRDDRAPPGSGEDPPAHGAPRGAY